MAGRRRKRKKRGQLTFDDARVPTGRGGWRPNAGRPQGRSKVAHRARPSFAPGAPLHVTLRFVDGLPSLRRRPILSIVRDAIREAGNQVTYRIVHFNLLANHLHLIVEAQGAKWLARGMKQLKVRLALRINALLARSGTLFAERYHARALTTPTEVRHALRYVLLNEAHHAKRTLRAYGVDPYSSGAWFDGWADDRWKHEDEPGSRPTAAPRSWLLTTGWKRRGLIRFDETPGPLETPLRRSRNAAADRSGQTAHNPGRIWSCGSQSIAE